MKGSNPGKPCCTKDAWCWLVLPGNTSGMGGGTRQGMGAKSWQDVVSLRGAEGDEAGD